jgi:hypothetical protein
MSAYQLNLAIDQRPAAVAFPESPQDVAATVQFTRGRPARRGAGHRGRSCSQKQDAATFWTEQAYHRLGRIKPPSTPMTSSAQTTPSRAQTTTRNVSDAQPYHPIA